MNANDSSRFLMLLYAAFHIGSVALAEPESIAPEPAAALSAWIADLDSGDYAVRYDARLKIQSLMADASRPGADTAAAAGLEAILLQSLESVTDLASRCWNIRMLERFGGEASINTLEKLLDAPDGEVRDSARRALTANLSPRAGRVLEERLSRANAEAQPALIDALASRGNQQASASIAPLLTSDDPHVVECAIAALGKLGDPASLPHLGQARASAADLRLQTLTEAAMLQIGPDRETARDLAMTAGRPDLRGEAFRQLAAAAPSDAAALLSRVTADPDDPARPDILLAAMRAGSREAEGAALALLPALNDTEQCLLLHAVTDRMLTGHERQLLAFLPEAEGRTRDAVILALGATGTGASTDTLFERLSGQPDEAVIRALGRLRDPEVDRRLFALTAGTNHDAGVIAAIRVLALRLPDGADERLHDLITQKQPEPVRKAALNELESVGSLETARILAAAVTGADPLKRAQQGTLKKLSVRLAIPDLLWEAAFKPAFDNAPDDAGRADLLAILDGAAGPGTLAFLKGLIIPPGHPLQDAARKTLSRWPDPFAAGGLWVELASAAADSPDDLRAAQEGILTTLDRINDHDVEKKCGLAANAINSSADPDFKRRTAEKLPVYTGHRQRIAESALGSLLDDPDAGAELHRVLGRALPATNTMSAPAG